MRSKVVSVGSAESPKLGYCRLFMNVAPCTVLPCTLPRKSSNQGLELKIKSFLQDVSTQKKDPVRATPGSVFPQVQEILQKYRSQAWMKNKKKR